jgi:hypothetical protein
MRTSTRSAESNWLNLALSIVPRTLSMVMPFSRKTFSAPAQLCSIARRGSQHRRWVVGSTTQSPSSARSRSPTSLLSLTWKGGDCLPRLPDEVRKQAALLHSLRCMKPMLISSVCLALRRTTARAVEAAHGPAPHRGSLAPFARALRSCRALRSFLEGIFPFHEDGSLFSEEPLPPCVTVPTIACPPSFTVTCSTRTVCSPPVRYRLGAST